MQKTRTLLAAIAFAVGLAVSVWTVPIQAETAAAASGSGSGGPAMTMPGSGSDAGSDAGSADIGSTDSGPIDWKSMDAAMAKRDKSFPAKTKGVGNQILKPKILADGTKQFNLTAEVVKWEVEPGKVVEAWTYNGAVPGPIIKVGVGDKVKVVLKNELPESTSIHWHGLIIPNDMDGVADVTQPPVKPGGTFTYSFTPVEPMVGWYHSHHDGVTQVAKGLYGTILIGDVKLPAGVKVSQEHVMALQDSGDIGLAINGKSFPATEPIRAHVGDWIMVHYVNAGNMIHPMHLHGMPQLVIAKDGYPTPEPYKVDTVTVAPGERYTVLIHPTNPGAWAWHCHIFTHSEGPQGMFGLFDELLVT